MGTTAQRQRIGDFVMALAPVVVSLVRPAKAHRSIDIDFGARHGVGAQGDSPCRYLESYIVYGVRREERNERSRQGMVFCKAGTPRTCVRETVRVERVASLAIVSEGVPQRQRVLLADLVIQLAGEFCLGPRYRE